MCQVNATLPNRLGTKPVAWRGLRRCWWGWPLVFSSDMKLTALRTLGTLMTKALFHGVNALLPSGSYPLFLDLSLGNLKYRSASSPIWTPEVASPPHLRILPWHVLRPRRCQLRNVVSGPFAMKAGFEQTLLGCWLLLGTWDIGVQWSLQTEDTFLHVRSLRSSVSEKPDEAQGPRIIEQAGDSCGLSLLTSWSQAGLLLEATAPAGILPRLRFVRFRQRRPRSLCLLDAEGRAGGLRGSCADRIRSPFSLPPWDGCPCPLP